MSHRSEWRFTAGEARVTAPPGFSVKVIGGSLAICAKAGGASNVLSTLHGPEKFATLADEAAAWLERRGAPPLPAGWLDRLTRKSGEVGK